MLGCGETSKAVRGVQFLSTRETILSGKKGPTKKEVLRFFERMEWTIENGFNVAAPLVNPQPNKKRILRDITSLEVNGVVPGYVIALFRKYETPLRQLKSRKLPMRRHRPGGTAPVASMR